MHILNTRISAFFLKRTAQFLFLSFAVAFITFWLSSVIPGDFFSLHLVDSSIQKEAVEQLRHKYGLDEPFYVQFAHWFAKLLRLDLGQSLFYQRPVVSVVANAIANTVWMGIPALILGIGGGVLAGTIHALFEKRIVGRLLNLLSTVALSLPSLLLGLSALLFAAHTRLFPLGGMNSLSDQAPGALHWIADRMHHLCLPVFCLTAPVLAYIERIQHASMQSGDNQLYLRCAHARGLSSIRIFLQYMLRPGLNPVLSITGPMLGGILSGSLVLEVIFAWPGLGQITYDALFNRDLFLLAGCVLGSSFLLVLGNLMADMAMLALDPRTRSSLRKGAR
jgi:peptide/nickel transport system permease protein